MRLLVSGSYWCDSDWLFFPAIATRIDGLCAFLGEAAQKHMAVPALFGAMLLPAPILLELRPTFRVLAVSVLYRFFDSSLRHSSDD